MLGSQKVRFEQTDVPEAHRGKPVTDAAGVSGCRTDAERARSAVPQRKFATGTPTERRSVMKVENNEHIVMMHGKKTTRKKSFGTCIKKVSRFQEEVPRGGSVRISGFI